MPFEIAACSTTSWTPSVTSMSWPAWSVTRSWLTKMWITEPLPPASCQSWHERPSRASCRRNLHRLPAGSNRKAASRRPCVSPTEATRLLTHLDAGFCPLELDRPDELLARDVRRLLVLEERQDRAPRHAGEQHRRDGVPPDARREHEHPPGDLRPAVR